FNHLRILQRFGRRFVQLGNDLRRGAGRCQQAVPGGLVQLRIPFFRQRGDVFKAFQTLGPSDGQCTQVTRLNLSHGRRQVVEEDLDLPTYSIGDRRTRALIGNVYDVRACRHAEGFTKQVKDAAGARTAVRVLAGVVLQDLQKFLEVLGRELRVDFDDVRHVGEVGDRHEVLERIVRKVVGTAGLVDGHGGYRCDGQRVAVGLG